MGVRQYAGVDVRHAVAHRLELTVELFPVCRKAGIDDRDAVGRLQEVPVHSLAPAPVDAVRNAFEIIAIDTLTKLMTENKYLGPFLGTGNRTRR